MRLAHFRDLVRELVSRDLKIRYKRSWLGIGWSLVKPISQLLIFSFLFNRVIPLNIPNYTAFLFTGVLVWSWFGGALTSAALAVTGNAELIRRPGFPVLALPMLTVTSSGIHFLLALPILFVFTFVETGFPGSPLLAFPLLIVLQFCLTLGLAYIIAAAHVRFRDTQHMIGILVMLGFYVTPIFYRPDNIPETIKLVYDANPMAWLLGAYRDILIGHRWPDPTSMFFLSSTSAVLLVLGLSVFNSSSARFVEEL